MHKLIAAAIIGSCSLVLTGCDHASDGALVDQDAAPAVHTVISRERDDVQFFPADPENKLYNTERAIQQYRARQAGQLPDAPPPLP